jgi:8-oxo-dGTP pyrophosphatase MutT (NUDIX family)
MVQHKKHGWLPPGGHVELHENPIEALWRELGEEAGLTPDDVTIVGEAPDYHDPLSTPLIAPTFNDIHQVSPAHRHVGMFYPMCSKTLTVKWNQKEHGGITWFTEDQFDEELEEVPLAIKYFLRESVKIVKKSLGYPGDLYIASILTAMRKKGVSVDEAGELAIQECIRTKGFEHLEPFMRAVQYIKSHESLSILMRQFGM